MRIIKCNKCRNSTSNELDFTEVNIYFPEKRKVSPPSWDEREKMLDEAELINSGLVEKEPAKSNELQLHLCPKHTIWFQQIFESDIRKIRRRTK